MPAARPARIPSLSDATTTLHSPTAVAFSPVLVTASFVKYFKDDTAQPKHKRKSAPDYKRQVGGEASGLSLQVESLFLGSCTTIAPCFHRKLGEGRQTGHLHTAYGRTHLPKFLKKVFLCPGQGVFINVHGRPFGHEEVLHLPQLPAHHVVEPAAHGRSGPANPRVAVNVHGVSILEQRVQETDRLGQHLYPAWGGESTAQTRE